MAFKHGFLSLPAENNYYLTADATYTSARWRPSMTFLFCGPASRNNVSEIADVANS
jgi:hypothetical protein